MSIKSTRQPHDPNGQYPHVCAYCGLEFRDNNARTRYCSFAHKQAANNAAHYKRHRQRTIVRVTLARKRRLTAERKRRTNTHAQRTPKRSLPDFDRMTPEELAEYIRQHPDQVRKRP